MTTHCDSGDNENFDHKALHANENDLKYTDNVKNSQHEGSLTDKVIIPQSENAEGGEVLTLRQLANRVVNINRKHSVLNQKDTESDHVVKSAQMMTEDSMDKVAVPSKENYVKQLEYSNLNCNGTTAYQDNNGASDSETNKGKSLKYCSDSKDDDNYFNMAEFNNLYATDTVQYSMTPQNHAVQSSEEMFTKESNREINNLSNEEQSFDLQFPTFISTKNTTSLTEPIDLDDSTYGDQRDVLTLAISNPEINSSQTTELDKTRTVSSNQFSHSTNINQHLNFCTTDNATTTISTTKSDITTESDITDSDNNLNNPEKVTENVGGAISETRSNIHDNSTNSAFIREYIAKIIENSQKISENIPDVKLDTPENNENIRLKKRYTQTVNDNITAICGEILGVSEDIWEMDEGSLQMDDDLPESDDDLDSGIREMDALSLVRIRVGAVSYELQQQTFRLIESVVRAHAHVMVCGRTGREEFHLYRDSSAFNSVLGYHCSGELHMPMDTCPRLFKKELEFWGLNESQLELCCAERLRSLGHEEESHQPGLPPHSPRWAWWRRLLLMVYMVLLALFVAPLLLKLFLDFAIDSDGGGAHRSVLLKKGNHHHGNHNNDNNIHNVNNNNSRMTRNVYSM